MGSVVVTRQMIERADAEALRAMLLDWISQGHRQFEIQDHTPGWDPCMDCGHPEGEHSDEYQGWDKRTDSYEPVKQSGTGCLIAACGCRRWFGA